MGNLRALLFGSLISSVIVELRCLGTGSVDIGDRGSKLLHPTTSTSVVGPQRGGQFSAASLHSGLVWDINGTPSIITPDLVVAKDNSGDFRTITRALKKAARKMRSRRRASRFVIYIKSGVYKETVNVRRSMRNLTLVGDGMDATVVTGHRSANNVTTTFRTATFAVSGEGFIARDMTFKNTAGPRKRQAVALRSDSDNSVFYRCSFKGYQDTLYAHSGRQFYRECDIYGTVDFVFGNAAAVFQNCNILVRRPSKRGKTNTVTAQGRTNWTQTTGFSFLNSTVAAAPDLKRKQTLFKTYLGRPWREFSRTVFIKCTLEDLIDPAGWLPWNRSVSLDNLYYGEYMNTGPGADTSGRVKWPGFHVITNASDGGHFTVDSFLDGSSWLPATGVPFTPGL